ncbi:MAG: hypothetical protein H6Q87_1932 [candidate division NC10 bacterium]|nr:hypothetical protein [candidate division NC10 bacterium]
MLIPALSGISIVGYGLPPKLAKAVRDFAKVLIRIPNHATEGVDPDAEPRHGVTSEDADDAEHDNGDDLPRREVKQESEVDHDDDRDEGPQDGQELALGYQVGLAGLVDQLRDLAHGLVDREIPDLHVLHQPEGHAAETNDQTEQQQAVAVNAQERHRSQVGDLQLRLARPRCGGAERRRRRQKRGKHFSGAGRFAANGSAVSRLWKRNASFTHVPILLRVSLGGCGSGMMKRKRARLPV